MCHGRSGFYVLHFASTGLGLAHATHYKFLLLFLSKQVQVYHTPTDSFRFPSLRKPYYSSSSPSPSPWPLNSNENPAPVDVGSDPKENPAPEEEAIAPNENPALENDEPEPNPNNGFHPFRRPLPTPFCLSSPSSSSPSLCPLNLNENPVPVDVGAGPKENPGAGCSKPG